MNRDSLGFRFAITSTLVVFIGYFGFLAVVLFVAVPPSTLASEITSAEVLSSLALSFITATIASALAIVVAFPVSYGLSRFRFPGREVIDAIVDVPIVLSPIAVGVALLLFFRTAPGRFLDSLGPGVIFERPGIVVAQFTVVLALAVRLLKSTFDSIGTRGEQVARILGASRWRAFLDVVAPSARSGIIAAFILSWARAMGEFGATITLAGAGRQTETLPVGIALNFMGGNIERVISLAVVLVVSALIALISFRLITRRRSVT